MMHPRFILSRAPRFSNTLIHAALAAVLFVVLTTTAQCDPVAFSTARQVAESKLRHHIDLYGEWNGSLSPAIADGQPVQFDGSIVAYNFTVRPSGHILVAVDDILSPVLLYSEKSTFVAGRADQPHTIESWIMPELHYQVRRIDRIRSSFSPADRALRTSEAADRIRQAWNLYTGQTSQSPDDPPAAGRQLAERSVEVGPLLETAWGQAEPFNRMTPDNGCASEHTLTGCVATAWAQLMRYWSWPQHGTGIQSYDWNGQTLSVDFSTATYDWKSMPATLDAASSSQEQIDAVSMLVYHVAVAAKTNFGCDSSVSALWADEILDQFFKYKSSMQYHDRAQFAAAQDWFALFKNELDASPPRPLILSIFTTDGSGHEVIVDGYRDDTTSEVHINFGWLGNWDGYYNLTTSLDQAGGYEWDANMQIIVAGIEPDSNSPIEQEAPPISNSGGGGGSGCFIMTVGGW